MSVIDNHMTSEGRTGDESRLVSDEQATFVAPTMETVADCLVRGRAHARRSTNMSQTVCVDLLLDCYNAAVRSTVREITAEAITEIAHVNLVRSSQFADLLDLIHMALAVDAAFDHLDLTA